MRATSAGPPAARESTAYEPAARQPAAYDPAAREPAACSPTAYRPTADGPIGVFDSGVGGLAVLAALRARFPQEDLIYVADQAFCPYGPRSTGAVERRAIELSARLIDRERVKLVVVACNTATIAAITSLRARWAIPFVGVEPAVKPAALATRSGVIGVLATERSLRGARFAALVAEHAGGRRVIAEPCPELVALVERGELDESRIADTVRDHVRPLVAARADTLVLGSTHLLWLRTAIKAAAGEHVAVLDPVEAIGRRVGELIAPRSTRAPAGECETRLLTTAIGGYQALQDRWRAAQRDL